MSETDEHLRTDHLEADLAVRSARGSAVTLVAQVTKFVVGLGAIMVLARLLEPDDFGVAAIALASVGILAKVKDAGFFTATVQSKHVAQKQASALFWLSVALASTAALLTVLLAPAVGWFYHDARLVPVAAALACVPLLDGLTLQLQAVMSRQMRFVALSVIDTGALVLGVAAAMFLATKGAGYWALVGQELLYSAAYAAAIWTVCRWRPGRPQRRSGVSPMVKFGLHLSGFRILNYLAMNLDTVFVGRFWGPLHAGIYDRAFRLMAMPSMLLTQPVSAVAVPALSRLQGEGERYRAFYQGWIRLVFGLTMPLVVFLFVDADRTVLTILGAQWMGLVPIFRVLAPVAFIGRLNGVTGWLYVTTGRPDRQLRWGAFLLAPMVVAYAIGVRWGALGVAAAHTIVTCTLWYPSVIYCCRTTPVRPGDVLRAMTIPAAASLVAGVGLTTVMRVLPHAISVPAQLLLDLAVYAGLYVGVWIAVPGGRRMLAQYIALARQAVSTRRLQPTTATVEGEA